MNKSRLRISLSASGKTLLFLAGFLLFAAQNTGNNLLYLMSSCFFACLVMAFISSLRNLAGLKVDLQTPEFCFAGQTSMLRCRIEDRVGRPHHSIAFEDDFVPFLPAGSMVILKTSFTAPTRGQFLVKQFKLFSCYPVDLFMTRIELPPDAVSVGPEPSRNIPEVLIQDPGGASQKVVAGKEGDYWTQSQYCDGEDASLINWKISAGSNTEWILVRSVNFGSSRRLCFNFSGLDRETFENSLRFIASLLLKLRGGQSEVHIWANSFRRGYTWLSLNQDMGRIVRWLASIGYGEAVPPADGVVEAVNLNQLMVKSP